MTKTLIFKNKELLKDKVTQMRLAIILVIALFVAFFFSFQKSNHLFASPTYHFNFDVFFFLFIFSLFIISMYIFPAIFLYSGIEEITNIDITLESNLMTISHEKAKLKIKINDFFTIGATFHGRTLRKTILIKNSEGLAISFDTLLPLKTVTDRLVKSIAENGVVKYSKDEGIQTFTLVDIDLS